MYNKFFLIICVLTLTSCASDNEIDLSKSINVFESKNVLPYVSKSERVNAKLNPVKKPNARKLKSIASHNNDKIG